MRTGSSFAAEHGRVRSTLRGARGVLYGLTLLGLAATYAPTTQAQTVETTKIQVRGDTVRAESVPKAAPAPAAAAEAKAPEAGRTDPTAITAPTQPSPAPSAIEVTAETARAPASPLDQEKAIDRADDRERDANKREIGRRLGVLEGRIEAIDQRRSDGSIAGPIAMLTAGYTTGIVALGVSLAGFAMAEQVEKRDADDEGGKGLDVNNDGSVDRDDEATFRRIARGMGIASAIGMGIGIAGNVILAKRLRERRQYDPELRELQRQRRDLRRQLNYAVNASHTGMSLALTGRF